MVALTTFLLVAVTVAATATLASCGYHHFQRLTSEAASVAIHRTETFPRSRIECAALCKMDPACQAFAFNEANGGSPCELGDGAALVATDAKGGGVKEMFLSSDVQRVDGDWEQWGEWSSCSCSTPDKTRTRNCGLPSSGGKRVCPDAGEPAETEECGIPPCQYAQQYMAVGGNSALNDVEIFDIESETTACQAVAPFPDPTHHRIGTFIDGKPLVCGGYYNGAKDYCYSYDFGTNLWSLESFVLPTATSYMSYTAMLPNGTWLIIGGTGGDQETALFHEGVMSPGPGLPEQVRYACGATINDTHVFIGAGHTSTSYARGVIIDVDKWEWTDLPDMDNDRRYPACGLIDNPTNGLEIVVAGGDMAETSSEIFSLTTMTWRDGPALPEPVENAQYAQIGPTFFMVGGNGYLKTIHKFDEVNYAWTTMTRQLSTGRYRFALVPLPNGMGVCS